jgi:hypothetical protein
MLCQHCTADCLYPELIADCCRLHSLHHIPAHPSGFYASVCCQTTPFQEGGGPGHRSSHWIWCKLSPQTQNPFRIISACSTFVVDDVMVW